MGTVSPNPFLPAGMEETFQQDILDPFVKGLQEDGLDFRGVIFIGLMIENGNAKVLEFNVRFGDPETQVILMRLDSDLYDIMNAVATSTLDQVEVKWKDEQVTCVVLASGGYPGSYEKGKVITGLDDLPDDIVVFHAGTAMKDGQLVTNGGRVLNVCAAGKNLEETRDKVYKAIEKIHFDGMYCRKDIGLH
jgi:phosphoribosylamine--glycine ligase